MRTEVVHPEVVPVSEGPTRMLCVAYPRRMRKKLDRIARETGNTRSATVRALLRRALDAFEKKGNISLAVGSEP